jgi:predicted AAA+ superfamily ATPase
MLAMYTRRYARPDHTFFLSGPRGTGKTTWLKQVLPDAVWFDLPRTQVVLELIRQPDSFRQQVEALPRGRWVVIDEVQRLPTLLNEVQALIGDRPGAYRFALSGSSARKLKRLDVNLLAGRAINRQFFPLTASELNYDLDLERVQRFGLLPQVHAESAHAVDILEAYVASYVREEILQEALVRNLESFARFLEVAALMNGQIVNVAGLARDAAVARPTVQGYLGTLTDTLIGVWLPAWRRRAKVKEVASPKFYLFDAGVARALAGRLREPLDGLDRGFLLETWVLHELRAAMAFLGLGGQLHFWRSSSSEVDFIWTRGGHAVGIEVKAGSVWRREDSAPLERLVTLGVVKRAHAIYTGAAERKDGPVRIWPILSFLRELTRGGILE